MMLEKIIFLRYLSNVLFSCLLSRYLVIIARDTEEI